MANPAQSKSSPRQGQNNCPAGQEGHSLPDWVKNTGDATWDLLVWVQPGAKKHEVVGLHEGRLKIRLAAPAVENKANKALLGYLAKTLKVRQNQFRLESGECSRQKRLRLTTDTEPDWNTLSLTTI